MRASVAVLLCAWGCSEPPAAPMPIVHEAPEPEAAPAPPPAPDPPVAPRLPDPLPPIAMLRMRREEETEHHFRRWDVVAHPDAHVRRAVVAVERELLSGLRDVEVPNECRAVLAHPRLVSLLCKGREEDRGSRYTVRAEAVTLAIDGGAIRPVDPAEAFVPGTDLVALALARCTAQLPRAEARANVHWRSGDEACSADRARAIALSDRGALVAFDVDLTSGDSLDVTLDYAALRDRIRPDGPLGPVLGATEGPIAEPVPEHPAGWALGGWDLERETLAQWMRLDDPSGVSLERAHALARLVSAGPEEQARAQAASIGAAMTRASWLDAAVWPVRWVRARSDLNLDVLEDHVLVLPRGALIAALGDELGRRGVVIDAAMPLDEGRVAPNLLTPHAGCRPAATSPTLIALVDVRRAGHSEPAVLLASQERGETRVELRLYDSASCAIGEPVAAFSRPGALRDLRLTSTTARGGDTLVLIGTRSNDGRSYALYRVGHRDPVWSAALEAEDDDSGEDLVSTSLTVRGHWCPIAADDPIGALEWSGDALARVPP